MIRKILIIFIITISLFSCGENDYNGGGNDHYKISENLIPLLFSPGSMWIYKNQYEGMDTIILEFCVADTLGPVKTGNCCTETNEVYNVDYVSSEYGYYSEHYLGYLIRRGSLDGGNIYLSSFNIGETNDNATIVAIHDTLVINGATYNQVVEMAINIDDHISSQMSLFYVDSVGIVKKIIKENMNDSLTWRLIKYDVTLLTD